MRRTVLGLSVAALLAVTVLMPWYVGRMAAEHGEHGMVGCPLMLDMAALCPMKLVDHLALWRSLLTTVLPQVTGSLLLAVVLICLPWWLALLEQQRLWERQKLKVVTDWLHYLRQHPQAIFHGALQWAFTRGILHPKIYPAVNR